MPNQATTLTLTIPGNILGNHSEAWINIRVSLEYQRVQQLFQILLNNTECKQFIATRIYEKTSKLDMVFNTHVVRE